MLAGGRRDGRLSLAGARPAALIAGGDGAGCRLRGLWQTREAPTLSAGTLLGSIEAQLVLVKFAASGSALHGAFESASSPAPMIND